MFKVPLSHNFRGVGGTEATLFTFELLEMYKKFVGNKGWTWNLLQGNLEGQSNNLNFMRN